MDLCRVLRLQRDTTVQWLHGEALDIDPCWPEPRSGPHYGDSKASDRPALQFTSPPRGLQGISPWDLQQQTRALAASVVFDSQWFGHVGEKRRGGRAGRAHPVRGNDISAPCTMPSDPAAPYELSCGPATLVASRATGSNSR